MARSTNGSRLGPARASQAGPRHISHQRPESLVCARNTPLVRGCEPAGQAKPRTGGYFLAPGRQTARSCEICSPHAKKNFAQQTLFVTKGKKRANRAILFADAPGRAKDPRKTNLARPAPFVWACRKWVAGARPVDEAARLKRRGLEWRRLERRRLEEP